MAQVLFRAFFNNSVFEEPGITDGTFSGTQLLRDINSGAASSMGDFTQPQYTEVGDMVFFQAFTTDDGAELWMTDGTFGGTVQVKDINPDASGSVPSGLTEFNGLLFFDANDGTDGPEPWVSDGTELGTFQLANIRPSSVSTSQAFSSGGMLSNATELFFDAFTDIGSEIWRTDGTVAGTEKLADGSLSSAVLSGNTIFTQDFASATGSELAVIDITTGSKQVIDIVSGMDGSSAQQLTLLGSQVIFAAQDANNGNLELWTSDGTALGTQLLKEINTDANSGSFPALSAGIELGGSFLFSANGGSLTGTELWITDGTTLGTQMVKDIAAGEFGPGSPKSSLPKGFIKLGNEVLFTANDETGNGSTLWKTDGTTAGTVEVSTINASSLNTPGQFAVAGDRLFFTQNDNIVVTDGTTAGTTVLDPAITGDDPVELTAYGNGIIYQARFFSTIGEELFYSDGTNEGSGLVRNIRSGADASDPVDFFVFGDIRFTGF